MKSKLFSSLLVLVLLANPMANFSAHAENSGIAYEIEEQSSSSDEVAANHAMQIQNMDESEIKSRLNSAADALDADSTNTQNHLMAASIRLEAAKPGLKKKMLKDLADVGDSALFTIGIAGSTAKQAALMPLYAFAGLMNGLVNAKMDRPEKKDGINSVIEAPALAGIILVEIVCLGAESFPLYLALLGGIAVDRVAGEVCESKSLKGYSNELCHDFEAYGSALDKGTEVGASAVGEGINRGVYYTVVETGDGAKFIFKGSRKLLHKFFHKKAKAS